MPRAPTGTVVLLDVDVFQRGVVSLGSLKRWHKFVHRGQLGWPKTRLEIPAAYFGGLSNLSPRTSVCKTWTWTWRTHEIGRLGLFTSDEEFNLNTYVYNRGTEMDFGRDQIVPDILCFSKTLYCDLPLAYVTTTEEIERRETTSQACVRQSLWFIRSHWRYKDKCAWLERSVY